MTGSTHIAYFGYGSLVNQATLRTPYVSMHRARLKGWRRTWLSRPKAVSSFAPLDGLAFLSAVPDVDSVIDGVVVVDHVASLADLDQREHLYNRHDVHHSNCEILDPQGYPAQCDLFIYAADVNRPGDGHPPLILRSYLDAVAQGVHGHFGEQGLIDFRASTANFHFDIHEDRHQPIYPRSVALNDDERSLFDNHFPGPALKTDE